MKQSSGQTGLAYGVFRCSDGRPPPKLIARFSGALENIRKAHEETGIPPETRFSVFDLPTGLAYALETDGAHGLADKIAVLQRDGANFMIRLTLPEAPNEIAARDLGDVLNMLYGGTELFEAENEGRAKLVMDIFYKDGKGVFVSKLAMDTSEK